MYYLTNDHDIEMNCSLYKVFLTTLCKIAISIQNVLTKRKTNCCYLPPSDIKMNEINTLSYRDIEYSAFNMKIY